MVKRKKRTVKKPVLAAGLATSDDYSDDYDTETDVNSTSKYGLHEITTTNVYELYHDIVSIDPFVFNRLAELGLELGKGFEVGVKEESELSDAQKEAILKDANELVDRVQLERIFCEAGRLLCQDGTICLLTTINGEKDMNEEDSDEEDAVEGITDVEFMPMTDVSFTIKGMKAGMGLNTLDTEKVPLIYGPIEKIYLYENNPDFVQEYKKDRVQVIRLFNENFSTSDIYGRATLGMYGRSLLQPILDTIRYRQNILDSYSRAVNRYGHMKLWFEYKALAELMASRAVSVKDAEKLMTTAKERISKLTAGEDVITSGFDVSPIETNMNLNIVPVISALENIITNQLLGTPVGAGKTGQTTFASAYVADKSKILVKESIRKQLRTAFEWVLERHLLELGHDQKIVDDVIIKLDPIVEPEIDMPTLLSIWLEGKINDQQAFDVIGWTFKPIPMEEQMKIKEEMMKLELKYAPKPAPGTGQSGNGHKTSNPDSVRNTSGTAKAGKRAEKKSYKSE